MKKNKLIAVILTCVMLFVPLSCTALAATDAGALGQLLGLPDFGTLSEILGGLLGGNGNDENNAGLSDILSGLAGNSTLLNSIREKLGGAADGVSNTDLIAGIIAVLTGMDISNFDWTMLTSGSFLDALGKYFGKNTENPTTTVPETTTAPETTTEEPTTARPVAEYTTSGSSNNQSHTYTVPSTTEEPTTYAYVAPETYTTDELSEATYVVIDDNNNGTSDGVTAKMVIGIVILVLSGAAVVAVAVVLKKSRV